jgi:hypothetical protein
MKMRRGSIVSQLIDSLKSNRKICSFFSSLFRVVVWLGHDNIISPLLVPTMVVDVIILLFFAIVVFVVVFGCYS